MLSEILTSGAMALSPGDSVAQEQVQPKINFNIENNTKSVYFLWGTPFSEKPVNQTTINANYGPASLSAFGNWDFQNKEFNEQALILSLGFPINDKTSVFGGYAAARGRPEKGGDWEAIDHWFLGASRAGHLLDLSAEYHMLLKG